ncbi:hypothetical protein D1007_18563 [Hordeum vulgare]|nr:hypothetical protein D1007_18563 [Hordeum vulgare]
MHHHVLIYHHCLATRPCERFVKLVNNSDYRFAPVDTTNDLKVLKPLRLACEKLVNIQGMYRVWGGKKKNQKDSLVDLAATIINPYYRDMKAECDKDKFFWHQAWVNKLDTENVNYKTKDAYTIYDMYRRMLK